MIAGPKFRAWVKPYIDWDNTPVPGYITKVHSIHLGTKKAIISNDDFGGNRSILFDYIELDQWTGACDKNSVEIYTEDILRDQKTYQLYAVKWSDFGYKLINIYTLSRYPSFDKQSLSEMAVVGNTYTWENI